MGVVIDSGVRPSLQFFTRQPNSNVFRPHWFGSFFFFPKTNLFVLAIYLHGFIAGGNNHHAVDDIGSETFPLGVSHQDSITFPVGYVSVNHFYYFLQKKKKKLNRFFIRAAGSVAQQSASKRCVPCLVRKDGRSSISLAAAQSPPTVQCSVPYAGG